MPCLQAVIFITEDCLLSASDHLNVCKSYIELDLAQSINDKIRGKQGLPARLFSNIVQDSRTPRIYSFLWRISPEDTIK